MSKELPYFKFFPGEWIAGDITLCSMEVQGVFANILSFYWNKNCSMCLANAKQRFSKNIAALNQLLDMNIIKVDKNDNIVINFLDEQMNEFINVAEKRAIAGKKGGLAKAKQMLSKRVAKRSNIDKIREDKDKSNILKPDSMSGTLTFEEKYKKFIELFNRVAYETADMKREFRGDQKSKQQFKARLKEGYTYNDFAKAIKNLYSNQNHRDNGFNYATPELITRADKLSMYLNAKY